MQNKKASTLSKSELILWVRRNISPQLNSIQELGTGAEFCLGIEILFPGSIDLDKIRFGEKTENGRRKNFKYLQDALSKMNFNINIPIENLIKGSFKYNLYFGQWFQQFFERHSGCQTSDLKYEAQELNKKPRIRFARPQRKIFKREWTGKMSEHFLFNDYFSHKKHSTSPIIQDVFNASSQITIAYSNASNSFRDSETQGSRQFSRSIMSDDKLSKAISNTSLDEGTESEDLFLPNDTQLRKDFMAYRFVLRALERNINILQQKNKILFEENEQVRAENRRLKMEVESYQRVKAECRMMACLLDRFREYT
ncbi:microtubule-associated protein RP/EB family member 1-like [Argonauta hians]